jgi:dCTP deaminase
MVQPSSIDVRLDRFFRVFENHRYPHIDPAEEQPDLTRQVEPDGDEPFILHPGEFVLASTYEVVTLPDDVAGRLEGKSSLGRLGLLTHSTAGFIDPGFTGARDARAVQRRDAADQAVARHEDRPAVPVPALEPGRTPVRFCAVRISLPGQRGPTPSRSYQSFHRTTVT